MTANQIPEAVLEAVARAICVSCEENPDHRGDARGNEFRWQDYRGTALAAVSAFTAAQQQWQAAADDMGGFSSDTAALAFLHIIGNGNPNVERAVERLRQSLIAQQPAAVDETAREDATPPATSPVRILIDAIESEIRQLEGKADWKSQTARIASLRAAIDAVRENDDNTQSGETP